MKMSSTICALNHEEWNRRGLQDFAEFADKVSECNVGEDAFSGYGEWFYIADEPLPNGDWVIYHGGWGNDNSPGASAYTHAEIFDGSDPDEIASFSLRCQHWEGQPEWADSESFSEDE